MWRQGERYSTEKGDYIRDGGRQGCTKEDEKGASEGGGNGGMERVHSKNAYVRGKLLAFTVTFSKQLQTIRGTFCVCTFIN